MAIMGMARATPRWWMPRYMNTRPSEGPVNPPRANQRTPAALHSAGSQASQVAASRKGTLTISPITTPVRAEPCCWPRRTMRLKEAVQKEVPSE
ncbi:MAG: hypothetical protein HYT99_07150 [Candidatus Tectomicrobia bacterium]|nr:hypothetical protein [Candidatus Tectomicrobia bacterium]